MGYKTGFKAGWTYRGSMNAANKAEKKLTAATTRKEKIKHGRVTANRASAAAKAAVVGGQPGNLRGSIHGERARKAAPHAAVVTTVGAASAGGVYLHKHPSEKRAK